MLLPLLLTLVVALECVDCQNLVLVLVDANNLDIENHKASHVVVYVKDPTVRRIPKSLEWPVYIAGKLPSSRPVWNVPKNFGKFSYAADSVIGITVRGIQSKHAPSNPGYTATGKTSSVLGTKMLKGEDLLKNEFGSIFEIKVRDENRGSDGDITLRFMRIDPRVAETKTTVYLTANSESEFNKFNRGGSIDPRKLASFRSKKDHRLSSQGFQTAINEASNPEMSDAFNEATLFLTSPFTRTIQTALLMYQKKLEKTSTKPGIPMVMVSTARDVTDARFGAVFTNHQIGSHSGGEHIVDHIKKETDKCKSNKRGISCYAFAPATAGETDGTTATPKDIRERTAYFSSQKGNSGASSIVTGAIDRAGEVAKLFFTGEGNFDADTIIDNDATGQWWSSTNEEDVEHRLSDFANLLIYSKHQHIAVSTHSRVILGLFEEFSPKLLHLQSPFERYRQCKVQKAHTIKVEMGLDRKNKPVILSVEGLGGDEKLILNEHDRTDISAFDPGTDLHNVAYFHSEGTARDEDSDRFYCPAANAEKENFSKLHDVSAQKHEEACTAYCDKKKECVAYTTDSFTTYCEFCSVALIGGDTGYDNIAYKKRRPYESPMSKKKSEAGWPVSSELGTMNVILGGGGKGGRWTAEEICAGKANPRNINLVQEDLLTSQQLP